MNKFIFTLAAFLLTVTNICHAQVTADRAIKSVKSYGFVDLEGTKLSAIIVEYNRFVHRRWVSKATYDITNYVIEQEKQHGFNNIIEQDKDAVKGNEGHIVRVYVNSKPQTSFSGGTRKGRFVVIEVNTAYMLKGSNLAYTSSMMAGVKQIRRVGTIKPDRKMHVNYTISEKTDRRGQKHTVYNTNKHNNRPPSNSRLQRIYGQILRLRTALRHLSAIKGSDGGQQGAHRTEYSHGACRRTRHRPHVGRYLIACCRKAGRQEIATPQPRYHRCATSGREPPLYRRHDGF